MNNVKEDINNKHHRLLLVKWRGRALGNSHVTCNHLSFETLHYHHHHHHSSSVNAT